MTHAEVNPPGVGSAPPSDRSVPVTAPETPEMAQLRAERDAAREALSRREKRAARGGSVRRISVGAMVVIVALLIPLTVTVTWVHRTVLNTDSYVSTVQPIASDPAVIDSVSRRVTDQIYAALDPEQVIADALPPKAVFLA